MSSIGAVIAALGQRGEIVLFDTPAITEEQDNLMLSKHVAGVLVVAEAGRVQQDQLQKTLDLLSDAQVPVLAIALNKVRPPRLSLDRLPWSREARNRARAMQRRRAHTPPLAIEDSSALKAPGD
jgi:Mrp family chromosome partitioning ATPase